jgi:hypothetical protein
MRQHIRSSSGQCKVQVASAWHCTASMALINHIHANIAACMQVG